MNKYAIIVAGGTGVRMKSETPKQFLLLGGMPVLMHSIRAFYLYDPSVVLIVVLPSGEIENWSKHCKKHKFNIRHKIVKGGEQRFYSVKNALSEIGNEGLVAIHDGVRPLVSRLTIKNCFETAGKFGNAIPVVSAVDSVRMVDNGQNRHIDRNTVKLVQTPQVFECRLIKEAYQQKYQTGFTDDTSVLESKAHKIYLVEGNGENIKITTQTDLLIAKALIRTINPE